MEVTDSKLHNYEMLHNLFITNANKISDSDVNDLFKCVYLYVSFGSQSVPTFSFVIGTRKHNLVSYKEDQSKASHAFFLSKNLHLLSRPRLLWIPLVSFYSRLM